MEFQKSRTVALYTLLRAKILHVFVYGLFAIGSFQVITLKAPGAGSNKEDESPIDPTEEELLELGGQLTFDEKTREALKRGNKAGVLLAKDQKNNAIYKIEIVGAKKVEPDAVILRLKSKIGERFSQVLIREDIREIYKMGFFSNVKVYQKQLESGAVVLKYQLEEIPTIFQIKIEGNKNIDESEIKKSIAGLSRYQGAKSSRIKKYAERIREYYVSKGYYLALVDYKIKETSEKDVLEQDLNASDGEEEKFGYVLDTTKVLAPDFVDVIFTIEENEVVSIDRISFLGNKKISDDILKNSIRTREKHLLSVLTDWGTFKKETLEIDKLLIEKVLNDNGMLKAKVFDPIIRLSADKKNIHVTYPIKENKQYRLGEISIDGDFVLHNEMMYKIRKENQEENEPVFLDTNLINLISHEKGKVFNKSQIANDMMAIAEQYSDRGYPYVNAQPIPHFDEGNNRVNLDIQISSGPLVTVERIKILGNQRTIDEVIRRELEIFEGDIYSSSLLRMSEQRIRKLGYFEKVEIKEESGSEEDTIHLIIEVKEQRTGNVRLGAGYVSGGEGLLFRGQISDQNLFGRGQTLSATINWSSYRRMFDVSFIEPYLCYLFDNPLSFAFTIYNRRMQMGEFDRRTTGGDITFGYPIGSPFNKYSRKWRKNARPSLFPYVPDFDSLWFYVTYLAERVLISDLDTDIRVWHLYEGVPRYTTSIQPTIRLDQRDNRMIPTEGVYAEFRSEFASQYLGGAGLSAVENYFLEKNKNDEAGLSRNYLKAKSHANNFLRFTSNLRFYHNLDHWFFIKGLVFKTNFELGFLNTLGQPLIFENYALGGLNTMRGYPYRSISPVVRTPAKFPFDRQRNFRIGGNKQIYGSFELEFPIFKALRISGVLFFDWGNTYSIEDNLFYIGGKSKNAKRIKPGSDPLRLFEGLGLYSSVGFGVRWFSPLGYLRFEWGIPLNRRPASSPGLTEKDPPILFHMNIGPSF